MELGVYTNAEVVAKPEIAEVESFPSTDGTTSSRVPEVTGKVSLTGDFVTISIPKNDFINAISQVEVYTSKSGKTVKAHNFRLHAAGVIGNKWVEIQHAQWSGKLTYNAKDLK